jgi:hypothetical protein
VSTLRAATEGRRIQSERGKLGRKQVHDSGAESAEREHRLHGPIRRIDALFRFCGSDERVRLQRRAIFHLLEIGGGREAGVPDRFEALNLLTERAGELSIDVEWTAAHAGDRTHLLDTRISELANDERLSRAQGISENAGDLDRKRLRLSPLKNRPDYALLARLQLVEWKVGSVRGLGGNGTHHGGQED